MKLLSRVIAVIGLLAVLASAALPAFAQEPRTKVITEEAANNAYRVTNPIRRSLSNVKVDFQAGQVVISATYTRRGQQSVDLTATVIPSVTNGRVYWTATTATINGASISETVLDQINTALSSAWRNYVRRNLPTGVVQTVDITESEITITYTPRRTR